MKRLLLVLAATLSCTGPGPERAKTTFQTAQPWSEYTDTRADAVMVYGAGAPGSLEERLATWREKGYDTDFMTGIAWGGYQDYFTGAWDGKPHWDEAQVEMSGDTLWHGPQVPYIVPTENYLAYFKEQIIRRVIDAGIDHIYLEEPEYWAHAGYSDAFKREWEAFYGSPWRPQDESAEATYLSSKLKYHLYYRAINEAFTYAKEYGRSLGRDIRCYVPTHSLVNYTQWQIVSPEASLALLPCVDGYIGQIWTGTSRVPEYYNGQLKERIFENAYLEFASTVSMTLPTGRRVWLLTDPIEDRSRDWADFRRGYEATYTAQMLFPEVADYEVMPWPERIYRRPYPVKAGSAETSLIPADFATQMQVMINASQQMPKGKRKPCGIAVAMANSLMFQRFPVHEGYEDPQLSNFYGLALPLLKRGVPVEIVHLENLGHANALKDVKVLLLTYSNMKPMDPAAHTALKTWVRRGGQLIYCGSDTDPFQNVEEWWNSGENHYSAPSEHLFELLGVGREEGTYRCGRGRVTVLRKDPKDFVLTEGADEPLLSAVQAARKGLSFKHFFRLDRGPYTLVAVMDESVSEEPCSVKGSFIDLFNPALPVYSTLEVRPGEQALLYNLKKAPKAPAILAAASRAYEIQKGKRSFSYICKGPLETWNATRILLPRQPRTVLVNGEEISYEWDYATRTCFLRFPNAPDGVKVEIGW